MTLPTTNVTGVDGGALLDNPPEVQDRNGAILYGQSLTTGHDSVPVLTTTAPVATNLTFGSGPKSTKPGSVGDNASPGTTTSKSLCEDDLSNIATGACGETMCSTLGAVAVDLSGLTPSSFVIFASCAGHNGSTIDHLDSGSGWYQNFVNHVSEAKALADAAEQSYAVQAVCWLQGTSEELLDPISYQDYLDALLALVADINTTVAGITLQTAPVHVLLAQPAQVASVSAGHVALAQLAATEQSPLIHLVASTAPFETASDGLHWSTVGQIHAGHYFGRAFHQLVNLGRVPDAILPVSVKLKSDRLTLKLLMSTPTELRFTDPVTEWTTVQRGFTVVDGSEATLGDITISNFTASDDAISMKLSRTPAAGAQLRYGLDYQPDKLDLPDSAFGDVRDSQTDTVPINGDDYPFWHYAPAFKLNIDNI